VWTLPRAEGLPLGCKGSRRMTAVAPWGWWAELPSPLSGGSERGRGAREGAPLSLNREMKGLVSKGPGPAEGGGDAQDCSGLAAVSLLGLHLGRAASSLCPLCTPLPRQRKCPNHTLQTGWAPAGSNLALS